MIVLLAIPASAGILAQFEGLSGAGGWAGAGLLGLVLAWLLLKHLPDKDKQLQGMVSSKDRAVKDVVDTKDATIKAIVDRYDAHDVQQRAEFHKSLQAVEERCERSFQALQRGVEKNTEVIAESTGASMDMRRTLEELREFLLSQNQRTKRP